MLISPTHEYDGWLKFVAGKTGMKVSCRNDAAKSVTNSQEYKELLTQLTAFVASQEEEDEDGESVSSRVRRESEASYKEQPDTGQEEEDEVRNPVTPDQVKDDDYHMATMVFASTPHREFLEDLEHGAVAELVQTTQRLVKDNEDLRRQMGVKSKNKTKHGAVKEESDISWVKTTAQRKDPFEHRPPLRDIPNPTRIKERPGGTTLITWVGDPWAINGDVLLVVTNWELNILNKKI